MTVTRQITNIGLGQPLVNEDGSVLANATITFILVNASRVPTATFDAGTKSLIMPKKTPATTNTQGEFAVSLWPTSRGEHSVFYLCQVNGIFNFVAPLVEGSGPISWADFILSGEVLTEAETAALAIHMQDDRRHLTDNQNAALDASHSPSAGNPIATVQDIAVAGGAIAATDVIYGLTRLATAAVNPADPVVVGDNDERLHTHTNKTTLDKITEATELPLWKGAAWPGAESSSGHTIVSPTGDALPQRTHLKFDFTVGGSIFAVTGRDDAAHDTTIILITFPDVISGGQF